MEGGVSTLGLATEPNSPPARTGRSHVHDINLVRAKPFHYAHAYTLLSRFVLVKTASCGFKSQNDALPAAAVWHEHIVPVVTVEVGADAGDLVVHLQQPGG